MIKNVVLASIQNKSTEKPEKYGYFFNLNLIMNATNLFFMKVNIQECFFICVSQHGDKYYCLFIFDIYFLINRIVIKIVER